MGHIAPALPPVSLLMALYFSRIGNGFPSKVNLLSIAATLVCLILIAALLFCLPVLHPAAQGLEAYVRVMSCVILLAVTVSLYLLVARKQMIYLIVSLMAMMLVINLIFIASLGSWRLQTNFPIAEKVKIYLRQFPKAKVVMFGRYYYAMPIYLNRSVPVISNWDKLEMAKLSDNWQREIYEGVNDPHKLSDTLMTYDQFRALSKDSDNTIIAIADADYVDDIERIVGPVYAVVDAVPSRNIRLLIKPKGMMRYEKES